MEYTPLFVKWGEEKIGQLTWDNNEKLAKFNYDQHFLEKHIDLAPFSMSIYAPRTKQHLCWTGDKAKLYRGLPPTLADALPDNYGDRIYKAWLQANQITKSQIPPLHQLMLMGNSAIGALGFEGDTQLQDTLQNIHPTSIHIEELQLYSNELLSARSPNTLTKSTVEKCKQVIATCAIAGGRQPKAVVAIHDSTQDMIPGAGMAPAGYHHYILKFDDRKGYPATKIELVYYKMAIQAGIHMMDSSLLVSNWKFHFLTKRFDRINNHKIHVQTLAAMAPLVKSYEGIFEVMHELKLPQADRKQQYLRMVFNVLTRNVDDHNKNFSFCMDQQGIWRLSPAYDITFSVDLAAPSYTNKHSLMINNKYADINRKDLESVAILNDIPDYNALINQVAEATGLFEKYAKELGIENDLIQRISKEFVRV